MRRARWSRKKIEETITQTLFWQSREDDGKAEDVDALLDKVFDIDLDDEATTVEFDGFAVDPADWHGMPIPERNWLWPDWILKRKVSALYGDGGVGKTTLIMQLAVAVALGLNFLGEEVAQGPVFMLLAENEQEDTHRSLDAVTRHYGVSLSDLRGRMLIASRAAEDNALAHFLPEGISSTEVYEKILEEVRGLKPALIVLDPLSEIFTGNENVRTDAYAFVNKICRRLAQEVDAAVVILAHPSASGMTTGEGTSGTTGWSGALRARFYMSHAGERGDRALVDRRVLTRMKINDAQSGAAIELTYRDGVYVTDARNGDAPTPIDRVVDEVRVKFAAGDPWSAHHQAGHRHIVPHLQTKLGLTKEKAAKLVHQALQAGSIVEVEYDPHSHKKGLATPQQARETSAKQQSTKSNRKGANHMKS